MGRWIKMGITISLVASLMWGLPTQQQAARAADPAITVADVAADHVELAIGIDRIDLDVIRPDAIRVTVKPNGIAARSTEVIGTQSFNPVGATITHTASDLSIRTSQLYMTLNLNRGELALYNKANQYMLSQTNIRDGLGNVVRVQTSSGTKLFGLTSNTLWDSTPRTLSQATNTYIRAGEQGGAGAPFAWSTRGFGVLVDTIDANFTKSDTSFAFNQLSTASPTYFLFVGNPAAIMTAMTAVTGRPPMFPKWALGFINSEWGMDENELLAHITRYRSYEIPLDAFTLDFDWKAWGEDDDGEFRWNTTKFPSGPSGLLATITQQQGVHLTGIFKPRIHVNTSQGDEATAGEYWWPGRPDYLDYFSGKLVNDLNFYRADARAWFYSKVRPAFEAGIEGYWNDEMDAGYPSLQGMYMQRMMYEGQRAVSNKRVWSINRNFYLGAQRYAYGMWSGDISTGIQTMADQRARMLRSVALGQTQWGMDSGGFFGTPTAENYARWIQFSAFTPIFRVHGAQDVQRQPWVYGEKAEAAAKAAIELRYKLMPYLYSFTRKATETGVGLVRPLAFDYPSDAKAVENLESWMFGDSLLVAPVVTERVSTKSIYLPAGTWYDYTTGTALQGGRTIVHPVDTINWRDIPLYVRDGAILATQPVLQYVDEMPVRTVTFDVFPTLKTSAFTYYEDDGQTYDYEQGAYSKQTLSTTATATTTTIQLSARSGAYVPDVKLFEVRAHKRIAKAVTVGGKALTKFASLAAWQASGKPGWVQATDRFGPTTYIRVAAGQAMNVTIQH